MTASATGRMIAPVAVAWFGCWLVAGACWVAALLGALSIGVLVLPVAVALTVLLATRRTSSIGLPGIISGAGLPLLHVAYLNRGGPGNVCTSFGTGRSCIQEWSPLPWLGIGAVLMVTGAAMFVFVAFIRTDAVPAEAR